MSIFGPGRLISENATIDIQTVTVSVSAQGGTVEEFVTTIAQDVPVLISRMGGGRDGAFNTDAQRQSFTVTGVDDHLRSLTTRLRVKLFPTRPELEGKYLRVMSAIAHPAGVGGMLQERISLQVQWLQLPSENIT